MDVHHNWDESLGHYAEWKGKAQNALDSVTPFLKRKEMIAMGNKLAAAGSQR